MMLVYGDHSRREDPVALIVGLGARAQEARRLAERGGEEPGGPGWIRLHAGLADLLVRAGELEQGLLDEQCSRLGGEVWTSLTAAATAVTRTVASALSASFNGQQPLPLPEIERALETLLGLRLPATIEVRVPEGYVLYGLYPEMYLAAAGQLPPGPLQVIGLRSIGTSLGAAVAAGAGTVGDDGVRLASVRPCGHPFDRRLVLPAATGGLLLQQDRFAIVDEGPGLSGSSFGSVADWLEDRGVPADRIWFFPSHPGEPGPQASERHRSRWRRARRLLVSFEELFVDAGCPWPIERWVEDLTGPALGPVEDVGAGRWRERLFGGSDRWPPVHLHQERRKFLVRTASGTWLLKSAGLGGPGEAALERAAVLQAAGLIPPVAGLRHGFLIGPWLDGARPYSSLPDPERRRLLDPLLDQAARYLALAADRFPAAEDQGASLPRLLEMAEHNTREALGDETAAALGSWRPLLGDLGRQVRRVRTDNRMHAWEWLVTADGRILKADALDHHRGHDLIGAQDIAWDLAGAAVELDLDEEARDLLLERVAGRGHYLYLSQRPLLLAFCEAAYLAFQLGHWTLGAAALEGTDPAEAERLRAAAGRYRERLRAGLASGALTPSCNRLLFPVGGETQHFFQG
jgi:hypothetical protein